MYRTNATPPPEPIMKTAEDVQITLYKTVGATLFTLIVGLFVALNVHDYMANKASIEITKLTTEADVAKSHDQTKVAEATAAITQANRDKAMFESMKGQK